MIQKSVKVEVLTPQEASQIHQQLFEEHMAKFRNLHGEMTRTIDNHAFINAELATRLSEVETKKIESSKNAKLIASKLAEVDQQLEALKHRKIAMDQEQERITAIKVDLDKQDIALGAQREQLIEQDRQIRQRLKDVEMSERVVAYERLRVEKMIKDNQIKDIIAKEDPKPVTKKAH